MGWNDDDWRHDGIVYCIFFVAGIVGVTMQHVLDMLGGSGEGLKFVVGVFVAVPVIGAFIIGEMVGYRYAGGDEGA